VCFPSNYLAAEQLGWQVAGQCDFPARAYVKDALSAETILFEQRLMQCSVEYRDFWLAMYANPLRTKSAASV
jgi:hypothetical protein